MAQEETVLIIGIILIVFIIAYGIFLYWSYRNRKYFFDYTPPQPANTFQPNGKPKTLTKSQQEARKSIILTTTPANQCSEKQNTSA